MKVINREELKKSIEFNAKLANVDNLETLLKVAGAASEIRLTDTDKAPIYKQALVLMGMNVYTIVSDVFTKAVIDNMHEILDNTELDESFIKELAEDDKRIGKM